ncbi:unnamed protein product [Bemisia tabaci]|uniref:Uncharacterized protein n=1 Tax=Bemisia tabaci TaxID=7038 RepID=A0A9P0AMS3_BEMTA|nr:unnamed protein product [Bemisia tabaci]
MGESTLKLTRRLRPYHLNYGTGITDPYVKEVFKQRLDKETLERLTEYTSGMYCEELHFKSLRNYDRPMSEDDKHSNASINHPSFDPADYVFFPYYNSYLLLLNIFLLNSKDKHGGNTRKLFTTCSKGVTLLRNVCSCGLWFEEDN